MKKKIISLLMLTLLVFLFSFSVEAKAETNYDGKLVKMDGLSTLYYVIDGKRYVFPNEKIYNSWFFDFSDVVTLSQEEMYTLPLAGNVRYRPGVILVKIQTNPKVYVVSGNGQLRWVKTEALARKLYGDDWAKLIDDVPDSFFTDYKEIDPIENDDDFDIDSEINNYNTIEKNHGLHLGHLKQKFANTVKCRAIPAVPAIPGKKNASGKTIPATPAISARICKLQQLNEKDTVAPAISALSVVASSTSAAVSWTTNELADSTVLYSIDNFVSTLTASSSTARTSHSITLSGLTASTTYKYYVKSVDPSGNIATSSQFNFTTTEQPIAADTQAPVISALSVVASSTSAVLSWTTDELADSTVLYSIDNFVSTMTANSSIATTSHLITLNSLTASTTYQYYVKSVDSSNNIATSSQGSFITLTE